MEIQCECGKFRAEIARFPKETPGRLKCYCDDCQAFMHHLGRAELLDANGGSEIIPVYPANLKVLAGKENLKCTRVHPKGMFRFSTSCCNTPVGNTDAKRPWVGMHRRVFPKDLESSLTRVRASIMGKYGHGELPAGVPQTFNLIGFVSVMPFLIKGNILGRQKPSPFFESGNPIVEPYVLSKEEKAVVLKRAGF